MKVNNINLFNFEDQNIKERAAAKAAAALVRIEELIGMTLDQLLIEVKKYIVAEQLIKTDTYYDIAWNRGYRIEKSIFESGALELNLAYSSESETILKAYEDNPDIKPIDFLLLDLPEITRGILKNTIEESPKLSTLELMKMFRIFEYPHYRTFAYAKTEDELLKIYDIIQKFDKISKAKLIEVNDKKFNFVRATRKKKSREEEPACFDGNCLDKKLSSEAKNATYFGRETSF